MFECLKDKTVLVTGGCGTVGHALAAEFKKVPDLKHHIVSRNEASQFRLQQKYPHIQCWWGDVANALDMARVFSNVKPDVVIHAAAVKVVPTAEKEMLKTFEINGLGTYNVAKACMEYGVGAALMIGTDKQCSPINVYGMTKHIGTSIFADANRLGKTKFISTRYGNVLCSRSSLGVIIMDQAKAGQPLTVTDPEMTRFFFTIQEGVRLIDIALSRALDKHSVLWHEWYGATISTQMCAVRLGDFFEVVAERFNVPVKVVGRRPGEKTHEHLMADYELKDTYLEKAWAYSPHYAPQYTLYPYVTIPHLGGWAHEAEFAGSKERPKQVFSSDIAPRLTKAEIWTILDYAYQNTWKD